VSLSDEMRDRRLIWCPSGCGERIGHGHSESCPPRLPGTEAWSNAPEVALGADPQLADDVRVMSAMATEIGKECGSCARVVRRRVIVIENEIARRRR
jgi:hypothetical protein